MAATRTKRWEARIDRSLMSADVFDSLVDSLDTADPAPNLTRRIRRLRA